MPVRSPLPGTLPKGEVYACLTPPTSEGSAGAVDSAASRDCAAMALDEDATDVADLLGRLFGACAYADGCYQERCTAPRPIVPKRCSSARRRSASGR